MNNRLETIVDLKKYSIQNLNSQIIKELIKNCKSELDQYSCSTIPNFILPKSLKIMNAELEKKIDGVYMSKESINPYLNSKDEPLLGKDHPKRIFSKREKGYLIYPGKLTVADTFRIGCIGYLTSKDMHEVLDVVKETLKELDIKLN